MEINSTTIELRNIQVSLYLRLAQLVEENAFSRIPLGVHIHMDCAEGLRLGYEISDAVNEPKLIRPLFNLI